MIIFRSECLCRFSTVTGTSLCRSGQPTTTTLGRTLRTAAAGTPDAAPQPEGSGHNAFLYVGVAVVLGALAAVVGVVALSRRQRRRTGGLEDTSDCEEDADDGDSAELHSVHDDHAWEPNTATEKL